MNSEQKSNLSNNNLRRMQGWARGVHAADWRDRCAVVTEYIQQLEPDAAEQLIKRGWPEVFATAERAWPEAFAGWKQETADQV